MEDLTGKTFGKLTVLYKTDQRRRRYILWMCKCECGKTILAEGYRLKKGLIHSCGCMRGKDRPRDLTGMQFGRLVVVKKLEEKKGNRRLWLCSCSCGNQIKTSADALLSGTTRSCGCLRTENARKIQREYSPDMRLHLVDGTSIERIERVSDSRKIQKNNSSGHTGVQKRGSRWAAVITFKKKNYFLGYYDRYEDAVKAREEAEEELYGSFIGWYHSRRAGE